MAEKNYRNKPVVLLLKSKNKDDIYERLLSEHGYKPMFVPVLSFKFINQKELIKRLEQPEKHSGIVFTSQRAVEAIQLCISDLAFGEIWSSSLQEKWSQLPVFVTGKATGKAAREKLQFSSIFGEESGSGEALALAILNTITPGSLNKELLFPCANIKKETLPNILKEKGYGIYCVTAYCTQPDPNLAGSLQKLFAPSEMIGKAAKMFENLSKTTGDSLESPLEISSELLVKTSEPFEQTSELPVEPSCTVFFSPSGVTFSYEALQTIKSFKNIKFVAIGHSTAQELQKHGFPVSGVPDKPDPQSLLKVIDSILG